MKRRNFFSKIAKGLLGIGLLKSASDTPVEATTTDTIVDKLSLPESLNSPQGFARVDDNYYIVDNDGIYTVVPEHVPDTNVIVHRFVDKRTGEPVKDAGFWCYEDPNIEIKERHFELPKEN